MIQDIIVILIILAAIIYTVYTVVKAVTTKEDTLCGDCFACGVTEINKQKSKKEKAWKRMVLRFKQG